MSLELTYNEQQVFFFLALVLSAAWLVLSSHQHIHSLKPLSYFVIQLTGHSTTSFDLRQTKEVFICWTVFLLPPCLNLSKWPLGKINFPPPALENHSRKSIVLALQPRRMACISHTSYCVTAPPAVWAPVISLYLSKEKDVHQGSSLLVFCSHLVLFLDWCMWLDLNESAERHIYWRLYLLKRCMRGDGIDISLWVE